ncbi:MAG: hypothetical protein KGK03_10815, partial [Candidatus Omnitrophica bacterium]|nr:hypothetical protein [Candidatus Omnitrophota bacterium]
DFAKRVTQKHYLRVDTNLSLTQPLRRFAHTIDPAKVVEISFSTHIQEREKSKIDIMGLVNLVKEFQAKGFKIYGNYVAHPALLGRLENDINFFASHGITVLPTLFQGYYKGKLYSLDRASTAYSSGELELIGRLNPLALLILESTYRKPCQAGCTTFWMDENYEISPCFMMRKTVKLGTFYGDWGLFPKVIQCPRKVCTDQYNETFCACLPDMKEGFAYTQQKAIAVYGVASWLQTNLLMASTWPRSIFSKMRRVTAKLRRLKWSKGRLIDPATWHRSCS